MTQDEFERLRARLEEQLRLDVEMLYEAHRVKLRAFETIRQARAELDGSERPPVSGGEQPALSPAAAQPHPAPALPEKRRGEAGAVLAGIEDALPELPEEFDKYDLGRALGHTPSKATLSRALDTLCKEKIIVLSEKGNGRFPARFRKLQEAESRGSRDATAAGPETGNGERGSGSVSGNAHERA